MTVTSGGSANKYRRWWDVKQFHDNNGAETANNDKETVPKEMKLLVNLIVQSRRLTLNSNASIVRSSNLIVRSSNWWVYLKEFISPWVYLKQRSLCNDSYNARLLHIFVQHAMPLLKNMAIQPAAKSVFCAIEMGRQFRLPFSEFLFHLRWSYFKTTCC